MRATTPHLISLYLCINNIDFDAPEVYTVGYFDFKATGEGLCIGVQP